MSYQIPDRAPPGAMLADLAELAAQAAAAGRLGLDTEFMGEGRYRTLLCLVQLAVPVGDGQRVEVLDPLDAGVDGSPLAAVLANPDVEVVVHAGRQDVALVRRWLDTDVRGVFDTQVAAGFGGLPAQASYDTLLSDLLGIRLSKTASYTRWDARPLSDEQVEYAREDVVHLLELADALEGRLVGSGRLEWAMQECLAIERSSDVRDLGSVFLKLPRVRGLRPDAQAVARELVEWREAVAAAGDRPVTSVLGDAGLVEIAKRRPASLRDLEQLRGINQGSLRRYGREIVATVERGRRREIEPLEEEARRPAPEGDDAALVALTESLARHRSHEAGLAYELVAARADLQAIVSAWRRGDPQPAVRTLAGWRHELVGRELLELLDGRLVLRSHAGQVEVVSAQELDGR